MADAAVECACPCAPRLAHKSHAAPNALAAAAIRELWEETGQILGRPAAWPDAPENWQGFANGGHYPDASALSYFFRAITPKGRPRRFDARFFIADGDALNSDPDDFSEAADELSHLQWIPLSETRAFDLPFITKVVLAELDAHLPKLGPPDRVPIVHNDDLRHHVEWIA